MSQSGRLIISSCIGGIVGVVLVRFFFLDRVEEIGWGLFWEGIGNGRMMDFGMVVQSATFAKCLAGLVVGGAVGMICAAMVPKDSPAHVGKHKDIKPAKS